MPKFEAKNRSSIRTKVLLVNIMLFLVLLGQGIYIYIGSSSIENSSKKINAQSFPALQFANAFSFEVEQMKSVIEDAVLEPEEDDIELLEQQGAKALVLLDSITKYAPSSEVDSLKELFSVYLKGAIQVVEAKLEQEKPDLAFQKYTSGIFHNIDLFKKKQGLDITSSFDMIKEKAHYFLMISLLIFFISVLILGFFFKYFSVLSNALKKLAKDAYSIQKGNLDLEVHQDRTDEIGDLQSNFDVMRIEVKDYIDNLDQKIKEGTAEISAQKKKVSNLLNNMKQAVFKIDSNSIVIGPVSAYAHDLFGRQIEGESIWDVVFASVDSESPLYSAIQTVFVAVFGEDELQWSLSEDVLPSKVVLEFASLNKVLNISYSPLWNDHDELIEIMFVVEDVTKLEHLEAEKQKNDEQLGVIQSLTTSSVEDLKNYFQNTKSILAEVETTINGPLDLSWLAVVFRLLHTAKGNASIFRFDVIAEQVHRIENKVSQASQNLKLDIEIEDGWRADILNSVRQVAETLTSYIELGYQIIKVDFDGSHTDELLGKVSVLPKNYNSLESYLDSLDEPSPEVEHIKKLFQTLQNQDLKTSLKKYEMMIAELSLILHKDIKLIVEGDDINLSPTIIHSLEDIFVHILRNSADHGIEPSSEREKSNKSKFGTITISLLQEKNGTIKIVIADDGAGIDAEKLYSKAKEIGLLPSSDRNILSEQEKQELIFWGALSSKDEVSSVSGRGVGMDVVKEKIEALGGTISLHSKKGIGTQFEIVIDSWRS